MATIKLRSLEIITSSAIAIVATTGSTGTLLITLTWCCSWSYSNAETDSDSALTADFSRNASTFRESKGRTICWSFIVRKGKERN